MLSFRQFLTEVFHKGVRGDHGDMAEIYKNPSLSEIKEYIPKTAYRDYIYLGAAMTHKDLYVWDRDKAMHMTVAPNLTLPDDWWPLYINYYPESDKAELTVSSFSIENRLEMPSEAEILAAAKVHPAFKIFKHISAAR
jgi:hypothetical protein